MYAIRSYYALDLYARANDAPHLDAKGLAVHIGSQIKTLAPLETAFGVMRGPHSYNFV